MWLVIFKYARELERYLNTYGAIRIFPFEMVWYSNTMLGIWIPYGSFVSCIRIGGLGIRIYLCVLSLVFGYVALVFKYVLPYPNIPSSIRISFFVIEFLDHFLIQTDLPSMVEALHSILSCIYTHFHMSLAYIN